MSSSIQGEWRMDNGQLRAREMLFCPPHRFASEVSLDFSNLRGNAVLTGRCLRGNCCRRGRIGRMSASHSEFRTSECRECETGQSSMSLAGEDVLLRLPATIALCHELLVLSLALVNYRVEAIQVETATYLCVQYANNDFPSYHLNTCRLNGLGPIEHSMEGWTQAGNIWKQFDCHNCNNASTLAPANVTQVKLTTSTSEVAIAEGPGNDMFPCCYYSKPEHSYIEPMQGVGENPAVHSSCEETFEGMTLFGSWMMDSMYNCIAFEYQM
eukprot:jgi/Bigna1/72597/fgenesh1_pg.20_\